MQKEGRPGPEAIGEIQRQCITPTTTSRCSGFITACPRSCTALAAAVHLPRLPFHVRLLQSDWAATIATEVQVIDANGT